VSPVRKRSGFFSRKRIPLLVTCIVVMPLLGAAAGLMFLTWSGYHSMYVQPWVYGAPPAQIFRAARKIYPFSIIPGGVYDGKELEKSMQLDPSLAEHYRDVRTENLVAVRTQAPMHAYVSFRQNGQICWTSKEVTIPKGELVLTDGQQMIRSRCGNRILQWKAPRNAVHSDSMTEQTQDLAMDAPMPSLAKLPPYLQPVLPPGGAVGEVWKASGVQPSPVPEPGVLMLFGSGVLFIAMAALPRG